MRWFGPEDPVPLSHLRMAGCEGVVTSLASIPAGEVWPKAAILERKALIEGFGMRWSVVESVPVHEAIKLGAEPECGRCTRNYAETLGNLGACGIDVVCYNFMPVVDWTRTDLAVDVGDGSKALAFDALDFAAFDVHGLERENAAASYDAATLGAASERWAASTAAKRRALEDTVIRGLPGQMTTAVARDAAGFREVLRSWDGVDAAAARANLAAFIKVAAPAAEAAGVLLAIHPDDPPVPLLGLPRVVSTEADLAAVLAASDSPANGLCFCAGSLASRPDNDVVKMVRRFERRIHFVHLRNVRKAPGYAGVASFVESPHLDGDVPVVDVVTALLSEQRRRAAAGAAPSNYARLPFRPDHGHQMCDDLDRDGANPGYTAMGRMRGLAELRGLQHAIAAAAKA